MSPWYRGVSGQRGRFLPKICQLDSERPQIVKKEKKKKKKKERKKKKKNWQEVLLDITVMYWERFVVLIITKTQFNS